MTGKANGLDGHSEVRGVVLWTVAIVIAAAYLLLVTRFWYPDPDSALFLGLAKDLVNNHSYNFMGVPHRAAPPGYPLLLAGLMAISHSFWFLNLVQCLTSLAFIYLCYLLVKPYSQRWALLTAIVCACLFWTWLHSYILKSEPLFGVISLAMWLSFKRLLDERPPWWALPVTLLLLAASCAVRIVGLYWAMPMGVVLLIHAWKNRPWKQTLLTVIMQIVRDRLVRTVFVLASVTVVTLACGYWYWTWQTAETEPAALPSNAATPAPTPPASPGTTTLPPATVAPQPPAPSHAERYPAPAVMREDHAVWRVLETPLVWLVELFAAPAWQLVSWGHPELLIVMGVPLLLIILVGAVSLFRKGQHILALGMLAALPCPLQFTLDMQRVPRYLYPVTPFIVLAAFEGLQVTYNLFMRWLRKSGSLSDRPNRIVLVAASLVVLVNLAVFAEEAVTRCRGDFYLRIHGGAFAELMGISRALADAPLPANTILGTNSNGEEIAWTVRSVGLFTGHRVVTRKSQSLEYTIDDVNRVFRGNYPFVIIRTTATRPGLPKWTLSESDYEARGAGTYWTCYRYNATADTYEIFSYEPSRDWPTEVPWR